VFMRYQGQLKQFNPKPGTPNQEAYTVIQVVVPTAQMTEPSDIADGYRYVGHRVEITLHANPLPPAPQAERPMERLWSSNGQGEERMRPGPTETCSECGKVIGDDPGADFYAPLAGPPRPVCGACAQELDDQQIAEDAAREEADGAMIDRGIEKDLATTDVIGEPLGDGEMPERPADLEPVNTPTRRRR
jgi:hypothetical protein